MVGFVGLLSVPGVHTWKRADVCCVAAAAGDKVRPNGTSPGRKQGAGRGKGGKRDPASASSQTGKARFRKPGSIKLADLKVGQKIEGVVRNLVEYGAYISVGAEKDGLLHVRDMSVDYVDKPEDVLSVGEKVKVYIKYIDVETFKLALSIVQRGSQERIAVKDLKKGFKTSGKIARITNFGVFVDIGATADGFLHVSELWGGRKRRTLDDLRYGQSLDVLVTDVDDENQRVRLELANKPETKQAKSYGEQSSSVPFETVIARPSKRVDKFDVKAWGEEEEIAVDEADAVEHDQGTLATDQGSEIESDVDLQLGEDEDDDAEDEDFDDSTYDAAFAGDEDDDEEDDDDDATFDNVDDGEDDGDDDLEEEDDSDDTTRAA